jgi:hypothetical protein
MPKSSQRLCRKTSYSACRDKGGKAAAAAARGGDGEVQGEITTQQQQQDTEILIVAKSNISHILSDSFVT